MTYPMSSQRSDGHDGHDHGQDDRGHEEHHREQHDHQEHPTGFFRRLKNLYHPHGHDSSDSIDSALETSRQGIRATTISFAGLMVTAVLQLAVVAMTGSVALLADTVHNFSDALTSVPLWIAFVVGRRAATSSYTFGYRRAEDLSGLFIVAMIALSVVVAAWESIDRLFHPRDVEHLLLLGAAGVIGFLGNEAVATYRIRIGRQIGSAALVADGHHARADGLFSLAVVVGAMGVAAGFPLADPVIGLLIAIAILFILRDAGRQVFRRLMDGVEPGTVERIASVARAVDGVHDVGEVRVRWVGHRLYASLEIAVDPDLSVREGHARAETVRHELFHTYRKLDVVDVHVDPHADGDHHLLTHRHSTQGGHHAIFTG